MAGDHSYITLHAKEESTLLRKWSAHWGWLYSIAVSADGSWFMSIGLDCKLKYWNFNADEPLFESAKFKQIPEALAWHPGGKICVIAIRSLLVMWDIEARREIKTLRGHRKNVPTLSYSPDGRVLASGSEDKTIRLWDAKTGDQIGVITGHEGWLRSITFIPRTDTLAAGDSCGVVRFWDIESRSEVSEPVFYKNRELGVCAIAVSPAGKLLAAAGYGGTIQIWQIPEGFPKSGRA